MLRISSVFAAAALATAIAASASSAFAQTPAPSQTYNAPPQQSLTPTQSVDSGGRSHSGNDSVGVSTSCGSGGLDFNVSGFGGVAQNVKAVSKAAKFYLENCHCPTATCVADALDRYADALDALGPQLPPQIADLPAIVRRSAQNVRSARTLTAARTAVKVAIATIDAKLKLLTVADADARDENVRSAHYVADTLNVAEVSLTRVSGL